MSRPTTRRNVNLEALESRELLAAGGPSAEAQYMLEIINEARTNPGAVADRVTSDLDPDIQATVKYYNVDLNATRNEIGSIKSTQPVAWNDRLAGAAIDHSVDLARSGVQSHTGTDGTSPGDRLTRNGYSNRTGEAENVYAYSESVDHAMQAFLVDWGVSGNGHRHNILQPDAPADQQWDEVGIGIIASNRPGFGPKVITQNFARRSDAQPYLLGVAFNDDNGNRSYDMHEGQGGVTIDALNLATGQTRSVSSWDEGGGYQIALDPGSYQVTARVGNRVVRSDRVSIGDQNVKVDYNLSDAWQATPSQPVAAPAPAVVQEPVSAPVSTTISNAQTRVAVSTSSVQSRTSSSAGNWVVTQPQIAAQEIRPSTVRTSSLLSRWSSWSARRFG